MAGISMRFIDGAHNKQPNGHFNVALQAKITEISANEEAKFNENASKLFKIITTSQGSFNVDYRLSSQYMDVHGENEEPSMGWVKEIDAVGIFEKFWSKEFYISDAVAEKDAGYAFGAKADELAQLPYSTANRLAELFYLNAIIGKKSFSDKLFTGASVFKTTGFDELPLFDNAHTSLDPQLKFTQSNKFTNGLTPEGLSAIDSAMRNFKGADKKTLGVRPKLLVICNDTQSWLNANAAVGSLNIPGANNAYNPMNGMYDIMRLEHMGAMLDELGWTGPKPFMLIDTDMLAQKHGACLVWFKRPYCDVTRNVRKETTSYIERMRLNAMFPLWQFAAVGNLTAQTLGDGTAVTAGTALAEATLPALNVKVVGANP